MAASGQQRALLIVGTLTSFVTLALARILEELHLAAGGLYH